MEDLDDVEHENGSFLAFTLAKDPLPLFFEAGEIEFVSLLLVITYS